MTKNKKLSELFFKVIFMLLFVSILWWGYENLKIWIKTNSIELVNPYYRIVYLNEKQRKEIYNKLSPDADEFLEIVLNKRVVIVAFSGHEFLGAIYEVFEDIACPSCQDVLYFICFDRVATVKKIVLVNNFKESNYVIPEAIVKSYIAYFEQMSIRQILNGSLKDMVLEEGSVTSQLFILGLKKAAAHFTIFEDQIGRYK